MRLDGRRRSNNVQDRRGGGGKSLALGGGIGAVIIAALIAWISGGNPLDVLLSNSGTLLSGGQENTEYVADEQDKELEEFAAKILAGTEDVWTKEFKKMGLEYEPPTLVLFNGSVQSGCGGATSQTGPFYCSADNSVYLDLSFFKDMRRTLGADGDFAYAYVIAHEVGHHVQNQLGILGEAHKAMSRASEKESNRISVR
nr:neutral zinc metallopeptidase [Paramuribaculum sp.]